MGVDSRMFFKLRGTDRLAPEVILPLARELAGTIGPEHFWITKGRTGHDSAIIDQLKLRLHHAMAIIPPLTKEQLMDDWGDEPPARVRQHIGKVVWFQDGPEIVAEDGEQFVEVFLSGRYYGPDYARGNWPVIRMTAEWIEMRIPGAEVWYGGDSSGCTAELFDTARRDDVNRFFLQSGTRSYDQAFDGIFGQDHDAGPVCPCCEIGMHANGGGGGRTFWYCESCTARAVTTVGKPVRWLDRFDDMMKIADEIAKEGQ